MTMLPSPCFTLSDVSRTSRAFSPKIARSSRFPGSWLGLTLGGDLADQDVARHDLGTDADDAALVEVGQHLVGDVGDVPGDLLRTQLGVARVDLVLLDVDRRRTSSCIEPLAQDDGVLVVVALPGMYATRRLRPSAISALSVLGPSAIG